MSLTRKNLIVWIALLAPSLWLVALAASAAAIGPEVAISPRGEIQINDVELTTKNALNLFSVVTWGLKWALPIDRFTKLEAADGSPIGLEEIQIGHRLEIKGRLAGERTPLDVRLIRDLSIGSPPPAAEQASVSAAVTPPTPPPAPPSPPPAPAPTRTPATPSPQRAPTLALPKTRALTQHLKLGMRGGEVAMLQEFLQRGGWGIPSSDPVTGYFGEVTQRALKRFQTTNGLPVEGVVGPKTRRLINSFLIAR